MKTTLGLLAGTALAAALTASAFAFHANADDPGPNMAEAQSGEAKGGEGKSGESKADENWDVTDPPAVMGEAYEVEIDVEEGTWMSLDVSPDGRTLAFDLLGDVYTLPVGGGTATNIASGLAWEMQPRWSPDGSRIAFTSDRGGGDNIWTMKADGSDKQPVSEETFRLLNNPTWSPDGRFIAARKHFTTSRSLGTGEIWLYDAGKGGAGVALVKKPNESYQKELGEPIFSPDGKSIYYSRNTTPGDRFIYAQDSNTEVFAIYRYDMETGESVKVVGGPGGAVRPTPSPDGRTLAFVKRVDNQTMLHLLDLDSGEERMVFDHLDADMQETWAVHGVYPNMDFSPDGKTLYFWAKGKIHALDVESGDVDHIEFRVRDTRDVFPAPRPTVEVAPDTFRTEMARHTTVSPDGRRTVFNALGKLYMPQSRGEPRRLTDLPDNLRELFPAFSRDGRTLVFVTWDDVELAKIHTMNVRSRRITTLDLPPGHYSRPAFSPDGEFVVYERGTGGGLFRDSYASEPGIYIADREGSDPVRISPSGRNPHFGADPLRVYFTESGEGGKAVLVSTNLLGGDKREHASGEQVQEFRVSPDGRHLAFRENYNLFATPFLPGPQAVSVSATSTGLPVAKISMGGASYPTWFDGTHLAYSMGPDLYMADAAEALSEDDYEPMEMADVLSVRAELDVPDGTLAITGARVVTMSGEDGGVIEDATILVEGDRIAAIGRDVRVPRGARTLDLSGKTVIPGIIDAHAHGPAGQNDIVPQTNTNAVAHLAFGVTTIFDPSNRASHIASFKEMQRAGRVLGPRTFSTGEVVYGAKAPGFYAFIDGYDDALEHVSRLESQGLIAVKNYNQPRREQRQQVVAASIAEDMLVVSEGGSLFHMDMSLVADGNSSVEHNLPQEVLYDDVIQMYSGSDAAYTPTLAVTYGGVRGQDYYRQTTDVWKHPILSRHVAPAQLRAETQRRQMIPVEQYYDDRSAREARKLMQAGVLVSIGAHGEREGLAAHWEMQSFQRGGMTPLEALTTATVNPAKHLGMWDDIGSLEVGKLADMVVIDGDPLEDIREAEKVEHVIQGGRVYESKTMDEVFTGDGGRGPYPWE